MRIFLYEFVTGGGWWSVGGSRPPDGSLYREGRAMIAALAEDFASLSGVQVVCLADARVPMPVEAANEVCRVASEAAERAAFHREAAHADWTVVIAPEFSGHLARRAGWVEAAGGRLLSPDRNYIEIAGNKHATAERLRMAGVPAPYGIAWRAGDMLPHDLAGPLVIKPMDGAGSQDVRRIRGPEELVELRRGSVEWRLESWCAGLPASVSLLCGRGGTTVLPASRQILSDDGTFQYRGGETPLPTWSCERAERLARGVVAAFPAAIGYIGVDIILGDAADGSSDVVIEVNPRLTTSYLGLRRIVHGNLAAAMLRVAEGELVELCFDVSPVMFGLADDPRG
jgi:predicted ATP-grasp superfamily ATP-dependent carboligase